MGWIEVLRGLPFVCLASMVYPGDIILGYQPEQEEEEIAQGGIEDPVFNYTSNTSDSWYREAIAIFVAPA